MQGQNDQNDQNDQNEQDACCCHGHDHVHDSGECDSETDDKTPYIDSGECRIPIHDGVEVEVVGGKLDPAEVDAYVAYAKRKEGAPLHRLVIHVMGDEVQLEYHCRQPGFQRIRRITGGPTV